MEALDDVVLCPADGEDGQKACVHLRPICFRFALTPRVEPFLSLNAVTRRLLTYLLSFHPLGNCSLHDSAQLVAGTCLRGELNTECGCILGGFLFSRIVAAPVLAAGEPSLLMPGTQSVCLQAPGLFSTADWEKPGLVAPRCLSVLWSLSPFKS